MRERVAGSTSSTPVPPGRSTVTQSSRVTSTPKPSPTRTRPADGPTEVWVRTGVRKTPTNARLDQPGLGRRRRKRCHSQRLVRDAGDMVQRHQLVRPVAPHRHRLIGACVVEVGGRPASGARLSPSRRVGRRRRRSHGRGYRAPSPTRHAQRWRLRMRSPHAWARRPISNRASDSAGSD